MANPETARPYSAREVTVDAVVHAAGVGFALIGGPILIWMVALHREGYDTAAITVYVATLIAMFSMSAGYNLIALPQAKDWLRRLDHSTIYLKIAGAYTPFAAISLGGMVGTGLLLAVWGAAVFGITLKILFPRRFEMLSLVLYLVMGWAAVIVIDDIYASVAGMTLTLMATSGVLYTLGVIFHVWQNLPYQNAIWHLFVLTATAVMYAAVVVEFA